MITKDQLSEIARRAERAANAGDRSILDRLRELAGVGKDPEPTSPSDPSDYARTVAGSVDPKETQHNVDIGLASIPETRESADEFASQEFGGYSLDQLRQMRDFKRSRVPEQYLVREWKNALRIEIKRWSSEATKHSDANGSKGKPAEFKSSLSADDDQYLLGTASQFMSDENAFKRYFAIQSGEHPDTGERIDFERELVAAKRRQQRENSAAIGEATAIGGLTGEDMTASDEEPELPDRKQTGLDVAQLGADAAGIIDPTGIVDGANAAVSLVRAVREPDRRGEHLRNAAISAVSMVPYVGDLAKIGKLRSAGKSIRGAGRLAKSGKAEGAADRGLSFSEMMINAAAPLASIVPGGGGGSPPGSDGDGSSSPPGDDENRKATETFGNFMDRLVRFASIFTKLVAGAVGILESNRLVNKGIVNLNSELAEYNPELAQAYAQRDIANVRRSIREGKTMEGTLSQAAEADTIAEDVRSEFVTPVKSLVTDITSTLNRYAWSMAGAMDNLTGFSERLEDAVKGIDSLTDYIDRASDSMRGKDPMDDRDEDTQWGRFFDDIADGKFDDDTARDRFFREWNGDGRRDERNERRRRTS